MCCVCGVYVGFGWLGDGEICYCVCIFFMVVLWLVGVGC